MFSSPGMEAKKFGHDHSLFTFHAHGLAPIAYRAFNGEGGGFPLSGGQFLRVAGPPCVPTTL